MEFRILGPLEVEEEGRSVDLGGPRPRALLSILLLHRRKVVSSDRLIEDLYGASPPATAAKSLQVHVSRLRKALGSVERLHTRGGGYLLELTDSEVDVDRFAELIEKGRVALSAGRAAEAERSFEQALALWRGPPLADVAYEDFAQTEISRLEELRLVAVEALADARIALGRHTDLVGELEQLVADYPLRERPREQLMLALYRSGRQAEALEVYQEARTALVEELGIEPGRRLRELHQAILQQEPELERTPAAQTPRGSFVGREPELAELVTGLDDAAAGHGRLILVAGEPGIGKSRLTEELIARARARGMRVLVGRCWEAGGAPAYWPWVQSLRSYVRELEPEPLRSQLGTGAADIAQMLPDLRTILPDLPPAPAETEGARFRLFDATAAFLRNASRVRPLVLVLDDLHAADEPSLLLLRFLARELGRSNVLVIGAYRDVDPTISDPLAAAVSELVREPVTQRISLRGLDQQDVADYISSTIGTDPGPHAVAQIHADTEGNPLFIGELVRLLAAEGRLDRVGGPVGIPPGVRDVIGSRVRRLSEPCRQVLTLASVLGREFPLGGLERLSELPRDQLLDVLDEAMEQRVIGDVPGASGRLRFAHALIRDTLYDELTSARRPSLHRRAGEALEALYADSIEPHLPELAHHFAEAAPVGTSEKAIHYARKAGDAAVRLLAYEEAVRHYELALRLATTTDLERCEILLEVADAHGRSGETPASKRAYRQAAELAESLGSAEQLARAALGYGGRMVWDVSRDDTFAVQVLERALAAIGTEETPTRARLLARLAGGPLRDASFSPQRKADLSRDALEMARRLGDPSTLAYALAAYVNANLPPDNMHQRLELSKELVDVALAAGDKERAIEGHEDRLLTLLALGNRSGVAAEFDALARLAEELRQPTQEWLVILYQALLALLEGRFAEAESLIPLARSAGERAQSWTAEVSYSLQLYVLRRAQGRLPEIAELIRTSAARYPTYAIWRCVMVEAAAALNDDTEARELLATLAADDFAAVPFDEEWLVGLTLLADATSSLGDTKISAVLYRLLVPYGDRVAVSYPEVSTGSVARSLGLLAATIERWDDAERHFEDALAMNRRIGARPWLARTQHDYAHLLESRGGPAAQERADALTLSAQQLADEIGMSLD